MEIRQIECFLAVAHLLNFSRAAETLYISQSALSQQISNLEREIGVKLFDRTNHSVELSPGGIAFYKSAEQILELAESAVRLSRATADGLPCVETISLGVEAGFSDCDEIQQRLSDVLISLKTENRHLDIRIREIPFSDVERALLERSIDIACVLMPEKDTEYVRIFSKKLESRVIFPDEVVLLGSPILIDETEEVSSILERCRIYVPKADNRILAHVMRICSAYDVNPRICFTDSRITSRLNAEVGMGLILGPGRVSSNLAGRLIVRRMDTPEAKMVYRTITLGNPRSKWISQIVSMLS